MADFREISDQSPKTGRIDAAYQTVSSHYRHSSFEEEQMKPKRRFIKAVIATTAQDIPSMPWARGSRRAAFVAKRNATTPKQKSA
ncbi:MAG: hypothetical protein AAF943_12510 [Pseudomonadota bacterium]